jgi:hypothetical protein
MKLLRHHGSSMRNHTGYTQVKRREKQQLGFIQLQA